MMSVRGSFIAAGAFLERAGAKLRHMASPSAGGFEVFLAPAALAFNQARLDHLGSLGLGIAGKRVLEVGAGIGLMTGFFEQLGCEVVSTEGRADNVAEIRRRYPHRTVKQMNLNDGEDWAALGHFDCVFCYGTLYHLAEPERALASLAAVGDTLLLETCTWPGAHDDVNLVREGPALNQAIGQVGCRPTRAWIVKRLQALWGHAYVTVDQPDSDEFETDWVLPYKHGNHRAVFVASRTPLDLPRLTTALPERQARWRPSGARG
ncbi:MAG: class I SAM-dependent methyltransferase [Vicinamibacterales bacterium]